MLKATGRLASWLRRNRRWVILYIALLGASHLVQLAAPAAPPLISPENATRRAIDAPAMTRAGPVADRSARLSLLDWPAPENASESKTPVILLHGSPGSAWNFARLAPLINETDRRVIALDLPGFGESDKRVPNYSLRAHARYTLAAMDRLDIGRAHIVGFSMGGGVGLWISQWAPRRVASLTMLSSIGLQQAEGSGDYYFEHTKYAIGFAVIAALPEAIPHFGLFGPFSARFAFMRNFWDTDQRPLEQVMRDLETPTLILHGRDDFLVPAWGARRHHELISPSRLITLDAGHFLPFLQAEETAEHLRPFLERHDSPGAPALRYAADFAPRESRGAGADLGPFHIVGATPWWLVVLFIVIATFISEDATVIAVGVLVAGGLIDWSVGLLACFLGIAIGDGGLWAIGRFVGRPALHWPLLRAWLPEKAIERWGRWFDHHSIKAVFIARAIPGLRLPTYLAAGLLSKRTHGFLFWAVVAALVWTPLLLLLSALIGPPLLRAFETIFGGPLAVILSVIVILIGVRVFSYMFTWTGRRRLVRDAWMLVRPEFWPPWLFYIPLGPWLAWLAIRHGGPMTFTCANPAIPHGGGVVGESKHQILQGFLPSVSERIAPTRRIEAGPEPEARADLLDQLVRADERLGGYPVILKPDESQRGHGFKVIRSRDDALDYFRDMTRAALLQAFDPGPREVGVLWARRIDGHGLAEDGEIFSITRKTFPEIEGDGKRTLEELIWRHPRFRMQADTFLRRHADQTDRVLTQGERMSLAVAGNHCQGTMFTDGDDLITDELTERINQIACSFDQRAAGCEATFDPPGFDFGRFDIRYRDDESLRRGENFTIIELNGTMSESTNLYDPSKPLWWTYTVLFRQWARLYRIGARRRAAGVRPMRIGELLVAIRDHYKGRPGSAVSD